jgi:hypothetical protein
MKCLKVRFAFPAVVAENHPVVGYDPVRSGFIIFVMMDVARSSVSSMHGVVSDLCGRRKPEGGGCVVCSVLN